MNAQVPGSAQSDSREERPQTLSGRMGRGAASLEKSRCQAHFKGPWSPDVSGVLAEVGAQMLLSEALYQKTGRRPLWLVCRELVGGQGKC